jgi:voltage-gated potassium channel
MDIGALEGQIVICGWNAGLFAFLAEIAGDRELGTSQVLLVNELETLPDIQVTGFRLDNLYHMRGAHTQRAVCERAGIRRASRAVVVADTIHERPYKDRDARTVLATLTIERLNPKIYCVVELMDEANQQHLQFAGVEAILMRNELGGISLASACRHPELIRIARSLLTLRHGETMQRIAGPKDRMTFGDLSRALKEEQNALLIAVETPGKGSVLNPPLDLEVEPTDYLIVIV